MKYFIAVGLTLLCGAAHAETHTKSWFMSHPQDRAVMIAQCRNDPGTAKDLPNCLNAEEAADGAFFAETLKRIDEEDKKNPEMFCNALTPSQRTIPSVRAAVGCR